MVGLFENLPGPDDFMPHGDCLVWNPGLLGLHVGSDILTGAAYYFIAGLLLYLVMKRRDIPFKGMILLFGLFIFFCGSTHLMAAYTVYVAAYWVEGVVKLLTALISAGTAALLIPILPKALRLPNLTSALDENTKLNKKLTDRVAILNEEIGRRELSEQELKISQNRYMTLVNNLPQKIFVKDAESRYVSCNEHYARYLGTTPETVVGKSDYDFFPREFADKYRTEDSAVMESGKVVEIEERYLRGAAEKFVHKVKSPIQDEQGATTGILGMFWDITDRKSAEREKAKLQDHLQQAQKMEAIGTLAGGIAHDFNNILGAILGYSELAMQEVPAGSELAEDLSEVVKAGQRARELVKQILTFSRKDDRDRRPTQAHLVVGEALKLLRQTIPANLPIESHVCQQDDTVLANPTQLHQIVMNLCTNAYHAMREGGGTLSIDLTPVEVSPGLAAQVPELKEGPHLRLSVADTGTGMDPVTLSRALEPFFTTKPKGEGTGMGLSVVHGIVRSHDGALRIDSRLGEGTRIEVYLPRYVGDAVRTDQSASTIPGGSERILVVDDEPALVRVTRKLLSGMGYSVESATTSDQALSLFLEDPARFDLVLTDQTMPGMTGVALARKLLEVRPELPIVICTGYSEAINEEKAEELGVKGFLHKPLEAALLARTLRKALEAGHRDAQDPSAVD